jgi:hypothetical protein
VLSRGQKVALCCFFRPSAQYTAYSTSRCMISMGSLEKGDLRVITAKSRFPHAKRPSIGARGKSYKLWGKSQILELAVMPLRPSFSGAPFCMYDGSARMTRSVTLLVLQTGLPDGSLAYQKSKFRFTYLWGPSNGTPTVKCIVSPLMRKSNKDVILKPLMVIF